MGCLPTAAAGSCTTVPTLAARSPAALPHRSLAVCRDLAQAGTKGLLAVPISFVSEHIETLEEIDCEYR